MSKTKCDKSIWPEGEQFTLEVIIPYARQPFPILVTFNVPAFDTVVEMWRNTDPTKAYGLFRQFISGWNQEEQLSDEVLIGYLNHYPGTDKAMFDAWAEYMKVRLAESQNQYSVPLSQAIN